MTDRISKKLRSWNMSRIRSKDTGIEIKVRKYLFANGFRYRKNDKRYPGTPDVVLPKYKTVIYINGCFWHRHPGCKYAYMPKSNITFWKEKFKKNIANDKHNIQLINEMGWFAITLWECELGDNKFDQTMNHAKAIIKGNAEH